MGLVGVRAATHAPRGDALSDAGEQSETLRAAYAGLEATGFALEQYRAAQGGFPDALVALVPLYLKEVPTDPYSGGPLLYTSPPGNPTGRLLYSVGPDGRDDGGLPLDSVSGRGDFPYPVR